MALFFSFFFFFFLMPQYRKDHIWYESTFHRYTSPGTKVKVICKGQGQISGSCFSKDGCFGALVFHKRILFLLNLDLFKILLFVKKLTVEQCQVLMIQEKQSFAQKEIWTGLKFCCLVNRLGLV